MKSESERKVRLLNRLLAMGSPFSADLFASAAGAIDYAFKVSNATEVNLADFAKKMMNYYDPSAHVEVLEFGRDGHFDSLFALPLISQAAQRLSGYTRCVLVISGMENTIRGASGRASEKRRKLYDENLEFIEDYVMRYRQTFPNMQIIFL